MCPPVSNGHHNKGMLNVIALCMLVILRVSSLIASFFRVVWYNLTLFGSYKMLPLSTNIQGRILSLAGPVRIRMGRGCRIGNGTWLATSRTSRIEVGDDVTINIGCVIHASELITIGNSTAIAEYVTIRDQEHKFSTDHGVRGQGYTVKPVEIGDNCWIGRGVYIGPGSRIGPGSIIGANSVVRGEFPPGVLIAGTPAKIKRLITEKPIPGKHS